MIIKDKCPKDHWHIAKYDSISKVFSFAKDETFYSDECIIDPSDPNIAGLLAFFSKLSIYQMNTRKNRFKVVQLLTSEEESIYYVGNYDSLSRHAIEWLDSNARKLGTNFFYVSGSEYLWSELE
jgi:hypothetical protein